MRVIRTCALALLALAGAATAPAARIKLRSSPRKRGPRAASTAAAAKNWMLLEPVPAQAGTGTNGWGMPWEEASRMLSLVAVAMLPVAPALAGKLPPNFVYLRDVKPSIMQDMRYASSDNFTGHPLPGYEAAECVLRADVAQALGRVQAELLPQNLSLKTYDCYRPVRAVRAFVRWAYRDRPKGGVKRFYPTFDKRTLFNRGFIAAHSRHSTGTTVDLTLVKLPPPAVKPYDPKAEYAACTQPAPWRAPDNSVDMGTGFDCFDPRAYTRARGIDADARRWRNKLVAVMRRNGFHNYFREWWHFSYYGGGTPHAWDFPITPRDND